MRGSKKRNKSEVFKARILNTEAIKQSKMEHLRKTRLATEPVAFYAYMTSNLSPPSNGHAIIFDHVQTNAGDGYDAFSGIFRAPSSGIYFFTWTIYSAGHGQTRFHIFVNYAVYGYTFCDTEGTGDYNSDSASMVVHLNTNDHVYIRTGMDCTTRVISNTNYGISTFAGWKIF